MSRRKQERPQQRLTLGSVEKENDRLVCGDCQTNFPLREITKFIRHKVNKCNKENVDDKDRENNNDDHDSIDSKAVISTKQTSISAPITRKETLEGSAKSPDDDVDIKLENDIEKEEETDDVGDRFPFKVKQVADAQSNTTNSEPVNFTCHSCRKPFGSAWTLLQHAQKDHGLRIYVTSSRESFTYSDLPRGSTPNSQKGQKPDDLIRDTNKDKDIKREKDDSKERLHNDLSEPIRSTSSVGSGSSSEGHSGHPSPHNPFMFPRMPLPNARHPLSPIPGLGPFARAPADFRLDMTQDLYHRSLFGMPGFEHGPTAPFHPFEQRPRPGMSPDDFYSQRLRQLASSTSPAPGRKHTPPFSLSPGSGTSPGPSMFSSRTPGKSSSVSSEVDKTDENQGSPGNHKSCEFCGKTFRFQSNLIVHRRSHTGEKPFKCPVCPHACTQQSKLKRHMKTHSKQGGILTAGFSNASEGSHASSSSTPDSNKNGDDDDADDDEDDEEEEEEEDMEIMSLQGMKVEQRFADEKRDKEQNRLPYKGFPGGSELAARLFDDRITQTITKELIKESEPNSQANSSSVLSEVIENSGFHNLPPYNEALRLAMAEKLAHLPNDGRPKSNPQPSRSSSDKNSDDKEGSLKRERPMDDSGIMSISKMIKKEPHEKMDTPPTSMNARIDHPGLDQAFFPRLWFPTPTEFFNRHPLLGYSVNDGSPDMPNGFGSSSANESTTNNSINATTPTTPLPTNGSTPTSVPRRDRSRNDTCEYCGKIFKNCSNLTVHRRSHTGEKPYKCMLCSYACAQSSKLTRHMKTHGRFGKDVYKCKLCGMPFSVPSTLEKHMRKCVENVNKVAMGDMEDTGSMSDNASLSDSQSATSIASLSLPTTPMTAASLGLPIGFSIDKHLRQATENNTAGDGDDTGSNSDATSVSEALTPLSAPASAMAFSSPSLSLASTFGLPGALGLARRMAENSSTCNGDDTGEMKIDRKSASESSAPLSAPASIMSFPSPSLSLASTLGGIPSASLALGLAHGLNAPSPNI